MMSRVRTKGIIIIYLVTLAFLSFMTVPKIRTIFLFLGLSIVIVSCLNDRENLMVKIRETRHERKIKNIFACVSLSLYSSLAIVICDVIRTLISVNLFIFRFEYLVIVFLYCLTLALAVIVYNMNYMKSIILSLVLAFFAISVFAPGQLSIIWNDHSWSIHYVMVNCMIYWIIVSIIALILYYVCPEKENV